MSANVIRLGAFSRDATCLRSFRVSSPGFVAENCQALTFSGALLFC